MNGIIVYDIIRDNRSTTANHALCIRENALAWSDITSAQSPPSSKDMETLREQLSILHVHVRLLTLQKFYHHRAILEPGLLNSILQYCQKVLLRIYQLEFHPFFPL